MTFVDAKQRFSNRVADYARYRPGHPAAVLDPAMMQELERIFRAHQQNGRVSMQYWTRLYFGQLQPGRANA